MSSASSLEVVLFFAMPGNEPLACDVAARTGGEVGELDLRHFPDGETYVRILSEVRGKAAYLVCTLARPDPQFLGLAFTAAAIAALGAKRLTLIAPYLAYMRQDRIFQAGEALTSRMFARLLQENFAELITIDPHLHRHASLDEVYDIPLTLLSAAPLFARWIADQVEAPLVIGPDAESAQWVEAIAHEAGAPWTIFEKERRGDRKIRMKAPSLKEYRGRTPVLVDDIISSGTTMKRALELLRAAGFKNPYCLVTHAICTKRTAQRIADGSAGFMTSNTVPNQNAAFDIAELIADALASAAAKSGR